MNCPNCGHLIGQEIPVVPVTIPGVAAPAPPQWIWFDVTGAAPQIFQHNFGVNAAAPQLPGVVMTMEVNP